MMKFVVSAAVAIMLAAAPLSFDANSAFAAAAKKPLTAAQKAAQERQKKCGAEWKEAKAAKKVEKGMTWAKFNAACQKRLKAAGA